MDPWWSFRTLELERSRSSAAPRPRCSGARPWSVSSFERSSMHNGLSLILHSAAITRIFICLETSNRPPFNRRPTPIDPLKYRCIFLLGSLRYRFEAVTTTLADNPSSSFYRGMVLRCVKLATGRLLVQLCR
jgi:hypothetical protein